MKKLIMFDLDGVLIDSISNMRLSWEKTCQIHDISVPFEEYEKRIGRPFRNIIEDLGIEYTSTIKKTYDTTSIELLDQIKIFEGVHELLVALTVVKRHKIAICTSKDIDRTNKILEKIAKFDYVCSPKHGLRGKPSPDQLLYTCAFCNVDPSDTLYVGDMDVDRQAAERAGIDFVHASYGYGNVKCEKSIQNPIELLKLLD